MTDDTEAVELSGDVHDTLLSYQREDESLAKTLDRVFAALVPHAVEFERNANIDRGDLDGDSRFVLERWPDVDNYVTSYAYRNKTAYLRAHSDMIPHVVHGEDVETDGGRDA